MFEDALEKLRKTMGIGSEQATIQKSELATPSTEEEVGGGEAVDIGNLASEAVVLFETGDLQPEIGALSDWAKGKGLPDSDIDEFSSAVIDSYFDDNAGAGGSDDSPLSDEGADGGNMGLEEVNKSILALKGGQALIAEGLTKVLEKDKKIDELEKEISVLKSTLTELGVKPAPSSQKTPVVEADPNSQQIQKGFVPADRSQAKEFELLILKGIKAGDLSLEEMSFFESTGKLSENAAAYVNLQKIEGNK